MAVIHFSKTDLLGRVRQVSNPEANDKPALRAEIAAQTEVYLARGGQIAEYAQGETATEFGLPREYQRNMLRGVSAIALERARRRGGYSARGATRASRG